jgi:hypothetical protein
MRVLQVEHDIRNERVVMLRGEKFDAVVPQLALEDIAKLPMSQG